MKVAIYTRVSGKSNRQDAANQSLQLVEYCQRQGWEYILPSFNVSGLESQRFSQQEETAKVVGFRK